MSNDKLENITHVFLNCVLIDILFRDIIFYFYVFLFSSLIHVYFFIKIQRREHFCEIVNLRTSHATLRSNRAGVNKMRATLDRKKQAVALASLFDVRIRNSSKRKSARLDMSDRKLSSYVYIYIHTHRRILTCLHAAAKYNECRDIAITDHQKWKT